VLLLAGAGDVAGFADRDEEAQAGEVQVAHEVPVRNVGRSRLPLLQSIRNV